MKVLKEDYLQTVIKRAQQFGALQKDGNEKLKPGNFSHQKSFYNKAYVKTQNGIPTLYSYNTPVVSVVRGEIHLHHYWNYSKTTLIHVKEFLAQKGFGVLSIRDLRQLPVYPVGE